jgi:hypothetical protein
MNHKKTVEEKLTTDGHGLTRIKIFLASLSQSVSIRVYPWLKNLDERCA